MHNPLHHSEFIRGISMVLIGSWASVGFVACQERSETYYPTYEAAVSAGALSHGWIPAFLPTNAVDIREIHDVATNESMLAFRFDESTTVDPGSSCRQVDPFEPPDPPFEVSWWPTDVPASALSTYRHSFFSCESGGAFLAFSQVQGEGFYWRVATAMGKSIGGREYRAYWLHGETRDYVQLVLTRRPLREIPEVPGCTEDTLLDCDAIIVKTHRRDSIWNVDGKPFKPLLRAERIEPDAITIGGDDFDLIPGKLEDILRLLENPKGTMPIHRIFAPVLGQEEFVRALALKIRQQTEGPAEEASQKP